MKLNYFQETNSFFMSLSPGTSYDTYTITSWFNIDADQYGKFKAVESLWATGDLGTNGLPHDPPEILWEERAFDLDEVTSRNGHDNTREFIHDREQDIVYLEFAGGDYDRVEEVIENVHAYIKHDDAMAGLLVTNASSTMDLETILEDGPPEIEFRVHLGEPIIEVRPAARPQTGAYRSTEVPTFSPTP